MNPSYLLGLILQFRYPILVPAAFLWGLLVCMLVGVAVRVGTLEFIPAYACVMAGELIGDVLWYWIGYWRGERFVKRFGGFFGVDSSHIAVAKALFKKYDQRILLSSKLTTGFGFAIPILFTAGMSRMSFWRYMRANLTGQFIWSGALIAVGYFFGDAYLKVDGVFAKITLVSLGVILILLFIGFTRYLGKRMRKNLA